MPIYELYIIFFFPFNDKMKTCTSQPGYHTHAHYRLTNMTKYNSQRLEAQYVGRTV